MILPFSNMGTSTRKGYIINLGRLLNQETKKNSTRNGGIRCQDIITAFTAL